MGDVQGLEVRAVGLHGNAHVITGAVDGPIALGDFGDPHTDGACDHEGQCVLLAIWKEAGDVMRAHLDGYTLASIASMARGEAAWPG